MKFKCKSSDLMKSIGIVEKSISQRTSLPILENLYLDLKGNTLTLRGNDLEIGIENSLSVEGESDGQVLIKAKTLSSIVSKLPSQQLTISTDDRFSISIKGDKQVDFTILGVSANDYPVFPSVESGVQFTLKASDLRDMIRHTIFAVSFDETKQFLNGVLIQSEGNTLNFVATDGYRLSLKRHGGMTFQKSFSAIVPFKAMNEFNKILQHADDNQEVTINISENQVAFREGHVLFISRVIQGQFPDYNQVLPKEAANAFNSSRRSFVDACERASIIAYASNNVVRLSFDDTELTLRANAAGMGEFMESISVKRENGSGDAKIAFNVRLILDSIKNLEMDDLIIEFNNELSPCVIKPVGSDDYTYIIMPIRTSDYQDVSKAEAASETAASQPVPTP